jgi:hypothetical protein|tara:strand:+ start:239 stop:562 length:324 start_codon:yes stop_codon:yes gene_type:complete
MDLASLVLMGFQDDLVMAFGDTAGWLIGHLILLGALALAVVAVRERDHIINHSGFDRSTILDALVVVSLTLVQYVLFTSTFGFDPEASMALAAVSSISIRWHIRVLG